MNFNTFLNSKNYFTSKCVAKYRGKNIVFPSNEFQHTFLSSKDESTSYRVAEDRSKNLCFGVMNFNIKCRSTVSVNSNTQLHLPFPVHHKAKNLHLILPDEASYESALPELKPEKCHHSLSPVMRSSFSAKPAGRVDSSPKMER